MAKVHSGENILPKASTPWAGRTNVKDRQRRQTNRRQTGGFAIAKTRTVTENSGYRLLCLALAIQIGII